MSQLHERRALWPTGQLSGSEQAILLVLLEGHAESLRHNCDAWQFAVNLRDLEYQNLSVTALQGLLRLGLVLHGSERVGDSPDRNIQRVTHRRLTDDSCFILSDEGVHLAYALPAGDPAAALDRPGSGLAAAVPSFVKNNDGSRTLSFIGHPVRVYQRYAQFQEIVLAAFEAKSWPARIPDPLPRMVGVHPKKRLRQTIGPLNLKQITPLLHFEGDGSGQGARWKPR
jgi:hypothetical protein